MMQQQGVLFSLLSGWLLRLHNRPGKAVERGGAKPAVLLLLLLFPGAVHAQLNESDTFRLQTRVALSGNYQQGNVNVFALRSRLDVTWAPQRRLVIKSQNSSLYQSFSSRKADNDLFSRNYIYLSPQKRVYPFGIAYISGNYRRRVRSRLFAGSGLTVQVLRKPRHVVKLSASMVYEANRFSGTVYNYARFNGSGSADLWRGTLYGAGWHYLVHNKLRLYYDAYWQPALGSSDNYRTQLDIGVDMPLRRGLAFTALYSYTHENLVIAGIKQDDRILTFGLSYSMAVKHR